MRIRIHGGLRERLTLAVLVALLIGGAVVVAVEVSGVQKSRLVASRTTIPGTRDVTLSEGHYVLYYEVAGGLRDVAAPPLAITITPTTGRPVAVHEFTSSGYFDTLGLDGRAIDSVQIPRSTSYRIQVTGSPPPEVLGAADVVLGSPTGHRVKVLVIAGLVALGALVALALILGETLRTPVTIEEFSP